MRKSLCRWVWIVGLVVPTACGGGDDDGRTVAPPEGAAFTFSYSAADLCAASVPQPTDLFRADDLTSERSACPGPSDPIEAAIDAVLRDEGASTDAPIRIPVQDGNVSPASLMQPVEFSLTSSVGTSTSSSQVPALVLLQRTGASTAADDWTVLAHDSTFTDGAIVVTPRARLANGGFYVLVATDAIEDTQGRTLRGSPAVQALAGVQPISVGAFGDIDAATAAKLERERKRLAGVADVLEAGFPAITRARILSLQGWTTALGALKTTRLVDTYQQAVTSGAIDFRVSDGGDGDIPPAEVFPPGTPDEFMENISAFRRGNIRVPKLLGDDGRIRAGWATDGETIDVPYLVSIPPITPPRTTYATTLFLPGYGRSSLDAREIAKELGGGPLSAVLAIDLPFHGSLSTDTTDARPNNDNPDFASDSPDGIPDTSGDGFFPGDPGVLRDALLANIIQIMHVLDTIKEARALAGAGINSDARQSQVHVLAHGHTTQVALHATGFSPVGTVQFPSGGIGISDLILEGPDGLREAFLATAPTGVSEANLSDYLGRLEATVLQTVSNEAGAKNFRDRYARRSPIRVLLNHGQAPEFVPLAARQRLIDLLELPASNVSRHRGFCDDFFIHRCRLQDEFFIVLKAREQIAAFISSGGQTIRPPAM